MIIRFFLVALVSVITLVNLYGQCNLHIYQCSNCGQNSTGINSPSNGKYCSGRTNTSFGHSWADQGLTPECQKQQDVANEKSKIAYQKMLSECEKVKVRTFKGATVTEWFCPSGKPQKVKYAKGIVEEYTENGLLSKRTTPKGNGYLCENFENGVPISNGNLNSNGNEDGEWYYKNYTTLSGANDCQNCHVVFKDGLFIGTGTIEEVAEKEKVKKIEAEFNACSTILDYETFRKKYPNSKWDGDALISIRNIEAKDKFVSNPTIKNLQNYEKVLSANGEVVFEHSHILLNLQEVLAFNKEVGTDGLQFTLPNDSDIYSLYLSILSLYHLTDIIPYLKSDKKSLTIYTTPKTKMIKMVSSRWTIRFFSGDQFTTLSNDVNNTYSVLKDGKEICSCNFDEIYLIENLTKSRNIKRFDTDYSKFCALRVIQIKGVKNSFENFLGFMNVFTHIEDKEYKQFLIDREITLKNSREANHTDYLFLAYLYWLNGNENLSLEAFKKTKTLSGTFIFESEKLGKSISFDSVDEFNKYLFNYYIPEFGWEIIFPNEKEMLKQIKKQ